MLVSFARHEPAAVKTARRAERLGTRTRLERWARIPVPAALRAAQATRAPRPDGAGPGPADRRPARRRPAPSGRAARRRAPARPAAATTRERPGAPAHVPRAGVVSRSPHRRGGRRNGRAHRAGDEPRRRRAPARPVGRDHRARHGQGPGHHADPGARLPARAGAAGAAAAPARPRLLAHARPAARGGQRGVGRCSSACRPRSSSASAATSPCRPTWPRAGAACPIVVHEANAKPGLANRAAARMTTHVFTARPASASCRTRRSSASRCARRSRSSTGPRCATRRGPASGCDPDLPTLLVFGGSQGAQSINGAVAGAAAGVAGGRRAGAARHRPEEHARGRQRPRRRPYVVVPYVEQMQYAYAAADFALCRCGAMTCAELAAVGLPAAYVPLPGRQRRAALQRRADRRRRRRPARRRRRPHRRLGAARGRAAHHRPGDRSRRCRAPPSSPARATPTSCWPGACSTVAAEYRRFAP